MIKYSKYKPSGIGWLGDIPERWEVKRLKDVSNIVNGSTPKSNIDDFWDGDITWVTPSDISKLNGFIYESEKSITQEGYESCGTKMVPLNSTILTCRAPIGNTVMAGKEICTNQGCKSLTSNLIEYRYLYYFVLSANEEINSLGQGTTFLELSRRSLGDTKLSFPSSKQEQIAIANYLDEKTSKLDQLISNKKKQIKRLKEIRQIEINKAVSKGLDSNVKLKPSGVEFIGDIPEHWEVKRLKDFAKIENGRDYKDVEIDEGGYPVYGSGGEFRRSSEFLFNKPSVLLGRKGTIDKPLLVTKPFWTVDTMFYTDIKINVNYNFFYYLCNTIQFDMYAYGSALPSMTQQTLHTINFSKPPLKEQTAIANYLDQKTSKIDLLVSNLENQIKQLQEIIKIEIYNAVTGKIRVA
jgi:type I restriction enzyme S subunit